MSIGVVARKILGKKLFPYAGRVYRRIFVDLEKVVQESLEFIPPGAFVLDIGGGDGEPLNHLLALRPDITVAMIDLNLSIGNAIKHEFVGRVTKHPGMSIGHYFAEKQKTPQVILINDVIHHIPATLRGQFFTDLNKICRSSRNKINIVIKDVEPGTYRATLSFLADKYISGDKNVTLISRSELIELVKQSIEDVHVVETKLYLFDKPNYSIVFFTR